MLNASEAVYGFAAWLTNLPARTAMSAQDNAASMAQRVEQFCKQNKLEDLREGWEHNLIHPYGQCHIHEDNFSAVKVFDLIAHLHRQQEFSYRTFGEDPNLDRVINHLRKEIEEVAADPKDILEWIDVMKLAMDGACRAGYSPDQIAAALDEKQQILENRKWPDPKTIPPGQPVEHIRK
jgi:DNA-binding transcriptional regulator YbjK